MSSPRALDRTPAASTSQQPSGSSTRLGYRPALDGLRGIAVLAVLLVHTWPAILPGGSIGVDLFFVLSGFLITTLLLEEHQSTDAIALGRFYARRALRLLPALAGTVVFALVLTAVFFPNDFAMTAAQALACTLYVSNWLFAAGADRGNYQGFLAHTWSLSLEEQFYLLWPIVLGALLRLAGRRNTLRMVIVAVVALAANRALTWHGDAGTWFRTDTRADSLLVGAALALAIAVLGHPSSRLARVVGAMGTLVLAATVWGFNPDAAGLAPMALGGFTLVAMAAAAMVVGALWAPPRALIRGPLVAIGRISYGLYLWHYPIVSAVHAHLGHGPLTLLIAAPPSFAIAFLSHRYLERPFLRLKRHVASPK